MIGVGTLKITDKHKEYVNDVLKNERLSYGPYIQKFEKDFAALHDCRYALMTNSGTSSLQIALAALKTKYGWKDGDEVIVPAVTFIATSNIVLQNNMKPVFVDVEPVYYEIDPSKIEAAITSKTRCIIPVHLFGCPCDMDPILKIAEKHQLRIIEDSCETMFTQYKSKSVGSFGDVGCFSTYVAHILTTGVGGLCTTNDPDLAIMLRSIMNHGRDSIYINIDDDNNKSDAEMKMIIKRRFRFVQMGYSYRATELEGALGLAELETHEEMMKKRWENGNYFIKELGRFSKYMQMPTIRPESGHAFMMFPIVLKDEKKDALVNYLEKQGIETRDMLPLTNQPFYQQQLGIKEDDYPVAKWINNNGFYIASHQSLSQVQKEYIVKIFEDYFNKKPIKKNETCLVLMSKFENEVSTVKIDKFLEGIPADTFSEILLADSSPTNSIAGIFTQKGMRVIHKKNSGKGNMLKEAVTSTFCEFIIVMGMDGSDDSDYLDDILIRLRSGKKMVIGSRFMPGGARYDNRFLSVRSIGNRFFSFLLSMVFNRNISDSNNLYRGFRKDVFQQLNLHEKNEGIMFEMTIKALKNDIVIDEFPVVEKSINISHKRRNRFVSAFHFIWILLKNLFLTK